MFNLESIEIKFSVKTIFSESESQFQYFHQSVQVSGERKVSFQYYINKLRWVRGQSNVFKPVW